MGSDGFGAPMSRSSLVGSEESVGNGRRHVLMPGAEMEPIRPESGVEGCDAIVGDQGGRAERARLRRRCLTVSTV